MWAGHDHHDVRPTSRLPNERDSVNSSVVITVTLVLGAAGG